MKPIYIVKTALCIGPSVVFAGLAYLFCLQPALELQNENKAVLDRALSFLENYLWDPANGSYREVPFFTNSTLAENHNADDNFLAYILHTEFVVDPKRASEIHSLLVRDNLASYSRWLVLSNNQANYTRYECARCNPPTPYRDNGYADHIVLDRIYYWKTRNLTGARERLNFLVAHT